MDYFLIWEYRASTDMADFDTDHDDSNPPDLAERDTIIQFLERNDISLPDGLTIVTIKSRGSW